MITVIKENYIETVYTLSDARKIINLENQRKRARKLYYIKQRTCGLLATIAGIATPFLLDGDATASLIFIPLGLFLMVTRQKVMTFN